MNFTVEQHAALKQLSAERGVSMSALVREAIDRFIVPQWHEFQRQDREAAERAAAERGAAKGGSH